MTLTQIWAKETGRMVGAIYQSEGDQRRNMGGKEPKVVK